jgi:hypothetical protein
MFQPVHCGLYFTSAHIARARQHQQDEPYRAAWAALRQRRQLDLLALAQWQGLIYRFDDDTAAGERAVRILEQDDPFPSQAGTLTEAAATVMTWAQCFEMVRDHPAFTRQQVWLKRFTDIVAALNQPQPNALYSDLVWLNALNLVAAVVLEDAPRFAAAVAQFQQIIQQDIHPEGYIRKAVPGPNGESLARMLLAAQALVLTAEAATHAGENLWAFSERGVSALTPLPYLLYYYYYPEKWRWDTEAASDAVPEEGQSHLTLEAVQALFRRHAGLLEIAQHQVWSKDRHMLLSEIRPVYDLWGGGLVTLTHGLQAPPKRRFGLF